jgi:translation initiation factor 2A
MGNGYKVWHYTSTLMHETHFGEKEELWEVTWQSSPVEKFPAFPIVTKPVTGGVKPSQPVASKQAYRLVDITYNSDIITLILLLSRVSI